MQTLWFEHLDPQYFWRWFCTDDEGNPIAQSPRGYFNRAEATQAMQRFRQTMQRPT